MTEHVEDFPWFPGPVSLNPITGLEEPPADTTSWDTAMMSGFSRSYPLAPGIARLTRGEEFLDPVFEPVEGYNPMDDPAIEEFGSMNFVNSQSPDETQLIIQKVQRDRALDRESGGIAGIAGEVGAFISNPLLLGGAAATGGMSALPAIATLTFDLITHYVKQVSHGPI